MTALGGDEKPTIISEKFENITNLHSSEITPQMDGQIP
jgi:hypothetical protein